MVLKELIFNSLLHLGEEWWSRKELIFNSLLHWEGVVVLKELIFNSFYFWKGFLTVSHGREWWS